MLNNNLDVVYSVLPLLLTLDEGLNHIKKHSLDLKYKELFKLIEDSIKAIVYVESALESFRNDIEMLNYKEIVLIRQRLNKDMNNLVSAYETRRYIDFDYFIKEFIKTFEEWKLYIEEALKPDNVS